MKSRHLIFLVAFSVLISCKKDPFINLSMKEKITEHSWQLSKAEIRIDGVWENYDPIKPCEFDDIYTFENDGTLIHAFGNLKCSTWGDEDQPRVTSWSLSADERSISAGGPWGYGDQITIESISDKQLILGLSFFTNQPERYVFVKP